MVGAGDGVADGAGVREGLGTSVGVDISSVGVADGSGSAEMLGIAVTASLLVGGGGAGGGVNAGRSTGGAGALAGPVVETIAGSRLAVPWSTRVTAGGGVGKFEEVGAAPMKRGVDVGSSDKATESSIT